MINQFFINFDPQNFEFNINKRDIPNIKSITLISSQISMRKTSPQKKQEIEGNGQFLLKNESAQKKQEVQLNPLDEVEQEEYDTLLYKWRQVQRQSLAANKKKSTDTPNIGPTQEHSSSPQQVIEKYSQQIVYYLKAKYLLNEIIEEVVQKKYMDLSLLPNVQFMYLICFRAWCDIHMAERAFIKTDSNEQIQNVKKHKGHVSTQDNWYPFVKENDHIRYLVEPMVKVEEKISEYFYLFHKQIAIKQKTFKNRLMALKNAIFHRSQKSERTKFMEGFQGIDFKRNEQIKYTQVNYIKRCVSDVKEKNNMKFRKMIPIYETYSEMMFTELHNLKGFDDFEVLKSTIFKEWEAKKLVQDEKISKQMAHK